MNNDSPIVQVAGKGNQSMNWFALRLGHVLELFLAVILLAVSVIVVAQVVLRYCFSTSITGANETITILFIYMSALGAAVAIGRREHIAIPMATDSLPKRVRAFVDFLSIVGVGSLNGVLVVYSLGWIRVTGGYLMPTTELPRFVAQASVPVGCGLAVFFCITLLFGDRGGKRAERPSQGSGGQR